MRAKVVCPCLPSLASWTDTIEIGVATNHPHKYRVLIMSFTGGVRTAPVPMIVVGGRKVYSVCALPIVL